jgi:hypothetical protein
MPFLIGYFDISYQLTHIFLFVDTFLFLVIHSILFVDFELFIILIFNYFALIFLTSINIASMR